MRRSDRCHQRGEPRLREALLLSACLVGGSLAGCRPRLDHAAQAASGASPVRLVHHIDWYEKAINAAAAEYRRQGGRLPVRQQLMPTSGLEMFFRTQLMAGQAPELMGNPEHRRFGRMGLLKDLTPLLDRPNPYLDPRRPWRDFFPEAALLNVTAEDGKLYGLPYERTDIGFVYNRRIFAELGIEPPRTWAEWMASCRKLRAAGFIPVAWDGEFPMGSTWFMRSLLDAAYRELEPRVNVRPTAPRVAYDLRSQSGDARETIDLEELYRAYRLGLFDLGGPRMKFGYDRLKELSQYFQPNYAVAPIAEMMDLFLSGRAAAIVQGTFLLDIARERLRRERPPEAQFEISIFPMPQFPEEQGEFRMGAVRSTGGYGSGMTFTLPAKLEGERLAAAVDFLHYLYSRPVYRRIYTGSPKLGAPLYADLPTDPGIAGFRSRGVTKIDLLPSDPQMKAEWYIHLQAYLFGRIDWPEFVRRLDRLTRVSLEREVKRGVLDPQRAMRLGTAPR